jgi:hypothetical protein
MMITQQLVAQKIIDYLNGKMELAALVKWSEDTLFALTESSQDVPNQKAIMQALGYLGAGDTPDFPLTWEVLSELLASLGVKSVRVEAA